MQDPTVRTRFGPMLHPHVRSFPDSCGVALQGLCQARGKDRDRSQHGDVTLFVLHMAISSRTYLYFSPPFMNIPTNQAFVWFHISCFASTDVVPKASCFADAGALAHQSSYLGMTQVFHLTERYEPVGGGQVLTASDTAASF